MSASRVDDTKTARPERQLLLQGTHEYQDLFARQGSLVIPAWSIGGPIKGYIPRVFPLSKGNLQKGRGLKYERSRVISVLSVEHHISLGSSGNPPENPGTETCYQGVPKMIVPGKPRVTITKCERRID